MLSNKRKKEWGQTCNIAILSCDVFGSLAWQEECGLRLKADFIMCSHRGRAKRRVADDDRMSEAVANVIRQYEGHKA
jgi:hypothetical protein